MNHKHEHAQKITLSTFGQSERYYPLRIAPATDLQVFLFCFPGAEVRPPGLPLPCLQLGSHPPGRHRTGPQPSKSPPSAPLAPPPPHPLLPPLPPLFFPGPLLRSLAPSLFPLPYSEPPISSSCVPLPRSRMVSIWPSEFLSPDFILAGQSFCEKGSRATDPDSDPIFSTRESLDIGQVTASSLSFVFPHVKRGADCSTFRARKSWGAGQRRIQGPL